MEYLINNENYLKYSRMKKERSEIGDTDKGKKREKIIGIHEKETKKMGKKSNVWWEEQFPDEKKSP